MGMITYKIVFDGKIKEGEDSQQAKVRLAKLFKADVMAIERLFTNKSVVIKSGLSKQQALQYRQMIEKTGVLCRVKQEHQPPPSSSPAMKTNPKLASSNPTRPSPSKTTTITCPKCGFEQPDSKIECAHCGIVFRKFTAKRKEAVPKQLEDDTYEDIVDEEEGFVPEVLEVEKEGRFSLAGGMVLAGFVFIFPFWTHVFHAFVTLVHELGHSIFGWIFGYPTIPAFDFMYGGGVALHFERRILLLVAVYAGFAFLFYTFRKNGLTLIILAILSGLYTLFAFTPLHEMLALFMGHGTELIFAGVFLYRAISGSAVIIAIERPLYAFLGFFTQFSGLSFAYKLLKDRNFLFLYLEGKGGITNDFVRIAEEYLRVEVSAVAAFFLFCSLLPPLVAFLFFRYKQFTFPLLLRILTLEPAGSD